MQEIARKGYDATLARHFHGDRQAFNDWLSAHKNEAALQKAAQAKLDAGETCVEIPCALHPDDDPFFPEPSWAERERSRRQAKTEAVELPF